MGTDSRYCMYTSTHSRHNSCTIAGRHRYTGPSGGDLGEPDSVSNASADELQSVGLQASQAVSAEALARSRSYVELCGSVPLLTREDEEDDDGGILVRTMGVTSRWATRSGCVNQQTLYTGLA